MFKILTARGAPSDGVQPGAGLTN